MCRRYAFIALLFILALPLQAQAVRERMLVSTDQLQRELTKTTVLYIGDAATYNLGHIPRATRIDPSALVVERDGIPNELPPVAALEQSFRTAGVQSAGRIVIYSDDIVLAARAWFTLDYLGTGERTALLDGGYRKWVKDGFQVSTDRVQPKPGSFMAYVTPEKVVRIATMRQLLRVRDQQGAALALIDARDRTGMQASVAYFVLRYLGYDTTLYDGSYIEWSNSGGVIWS